ncbi:tetratricopeptide repeat protein [Phytohabitans sp. ZYX-F-186]|uniref:Tetratricopeptide repeat protein n=1 Tax=Phytohabitans maris TaxID=3071409 RepID=A0ABU0ZSL6_9ACTN|nr:tetratricopeptide repeat protein [Phytohabitans sp. ZYX-F-186]MDQ7909309.1 tetratricopeptide repeat protein [Phytohabitans sp. ZYX-F-186]
MPEDDPLTAYLRSPEIARELLACGRRRGWHPRVPALPWRATDGYTGAVLVTVALEGDRGAEKVILKVTPGGSAEPAGYAAAETDCPPDFRPHLVLAAMPAWPMASGGVLTFQKLAADDVTGCRSMAELPSGAVAGACALVAGRLLRTWNPEPAIDSTSIGDVLRDQMGYGLAAGGSIRAWAREAGLLEPETPWVTLRDDGAVCPNPLLLARRGSPLDGRPVDVLVGRCHGDLHFLNVLLPLAPGGPLRPDGFQLIDLGGYSPARPVTTDPVFLMLSAIARGLHRLAPAQRQALLDHLVAPSGGRRDGYLGDVVDGVVAAVRETVAGGRRGWSEELRFQLRLSLIGVAVLFTSFSDLGPQVRWWFFRLAARLARGVFAELGVPVPDRAPPTPNPFHDPTPSGGGALVASRRPARPAVDRAVARAWRAAFTDPVAARAHLDAAYAELAGAGKAGAAPGEVCTRLRDLVEDATQILGGDDPGTLRLRHELARWTHLDGDAATALRTYREVAALRDRVLGPCHPDTLASARCARWPPLLDDAAHQRYGG